MCAEWISASRMSTSPTWVTPPGISSTLSSRKTSGEGRRQPLVYSIHGCNRTAAAIPRCRWIPPAWHPSSSAAGTSTTCTQCPASRASCWAGWTRARSASIPGILSQEHTDPSVHIPCSVFAFHNCRVGTAAGPAVGPRQRGWQQWGHTWYCHIHRQKWTAGSKHQLGMRAKIAVALIFVRQPYKKSSWSCWTDFKMYKRSRIVGGKWDQADLSTYCRTGPVSFCWNHCKPAPGYQSDFSCPICPGLLWFQWGLCLHRTCKIRLQSLLDQLPWWCGLGTPVLCGSAQTQILH